MFYCVLFCILMGSSARTTKAQASQHDLLESRSDELGRHRTAGLRHPKQPNFSLGSRGAEMAWIESRGCPGP